VIDRAIIDCSRVNGADIGNDGVYCEVARECRCINWMKFSASSDH